MTDGMADGIFLCLFMLAEHAQVQAGLLPTSHVNKDTWSYHRPHLDLDTRPYGLVWFVQMHNDMTDVMLLFVDVC
jgi:hypothetical protein